MTKQILPFFTEVTANNQVVLVSSVVEFPFTITGLRISNLGYSGYVRVLLATDAQAAESGINIIPSYAQRDSFITNSNQSLTCEISQDNKPSWLKILCVNEDSVAKIFDVKLTIELQDEPLKLQQKKKIRYMEAKV